MHSVLLCAGCENQCLQLLDGAGVFEGFKEVADHGAFRSAVRTGTSLRSCNSPGNVGTAPFLHPILLLRLLLVVGGKEHVLRLYPLELFCNLVCVEVRSMVSCLTLDGDSLFGSETGRRLFAILRTEFQEYEQSFDRVYLKGRVSSQGKIGIGKSPAGGSGGNR